MKKQMIARQLLKIAKELVSYVDDYDIGPFHISSSMMKLNGMQFPGKFYIVSAPYSNIIEIKDELKKLGFKFDSVTKEWIIFWKKLDKVKLDELLHKYNNNMSDQCPYEKDDVVQGEFKLINIKPSSQDKYKYHLIFQDDDKNKYHLITRKLARMKSQLPHEKGILNHQQLENKVGSKVFIIGRVFNIVKTKNNFELFISLL